MGLSEWVLLLILSMLWGGSFFFVGVAVDELPPFTIVALRVGVAALALLAIAFAMNLSLPRNGHTMAAFLAMALLNNAIPFSLIVWSQTVLASGLAAILNATTPLFALLVAHVSTIDEKVNRARGIGLAVGFAGVVVLVGPQALDGLGSSLLAQFACLAASLSYAFAGVFGRRFHRLGVPPLVAAAGQLAAATILLVPLAIVVDTPWRLALPSTSVIAAIAALAVLSTAIAYLLYFRILASAGATNLLLVTFLIPLSAAVLGTAFLGERFEFSHGAGMALIGAGLAAIDGRPFSRLRRLLQFAWRSVKA
jgi:drug/metabolite transporter (DMT)-like permease